MHFFPHPPRISIYVYVTTLCSHARGVVMGEDPGNGLPTNGNKDGNTLRIREGGETKEKKALAPRIKKGCQLCHFSSMRQHSGFQGF